MSGHGKKTLLLVEDEALIALDKKRQLERYGYAVLTALSGEEAVGTVAASPDIDLVLMDIDLGPGIDGTEAAERILRGRELPMVFVSSHTSPEVVERTERITSYGYVVKNSSITVLDASIKMAFKLFEAHRELSRRGAILHERSQLLANIVETFPGVVSWRDLDLVYQGCSSAFAQAAGLASSAEVVGRTDLDLPWKEHEAEKFRSEDRAVMDGNEARLHITETLHRFDGSVLWLDTSKIPLRDHAGRVIGVLGVSIDITERMASIAEMRKYQERLEFALDIAQLGEWEFDLRSGRVTRSDRWARMLGYDPADIGDSLDAGSELQHPDDRPLVAKAVRDYHAGLSDSFDIRYRMRTKSGEYKWIQDCGRTYERDASGKPLLLRGIHRDIDEQLRREEAAKGRS